MEDRELKEIIRDTAHQTAHRIRKEIRQQVDEGVSDALTRVGIDSSDPIEAQQDAQFVREWRKTTSAVKRKGLLTAAGILVAGTLAALWLGVKGLLG